MNQAAIASTRSSEKARAKSLVYAASSEKAFAMRAFIGITTMMLLAWFLTG